MSEYDPLTGERGSWFAPAAIVTAVLVALAALGWLFLAMAKERDRAQNRAAINEETLCLISDPPPETMFVLVDQSDHIPDIEMQNLYDDVMGRAHDLPAASLVVVFLVSGLENQPPRQVFSRCTPVDLTPQSEAERLRCQAIGCARDRRSAIWDQKFGEPLQQTLTSLEQARPSNTALITAFVQLGRMRQFQDAERKRVLVFSDMLENSAFIRLGASYPSEADLEQHFGQLSVRANLQGAAIDVAYIPRPLYATQQTALHQQWWREYFELAGAGTVTFDPEIAQ